MTDNHAGDIPGTSARAKITPEQVDAKAKRFATRAAGALLMELAEKGLTCEDLIAILGEDPQEVRAHMLGESWESYQGLIAISLAVGCEVDLLIKSNAP